MKLYRKQLEEPQFRSIIPCEKIIAELRNETSAKLSFIEKIWLI